MKTFKNVLLWIVQIFGWWNFVMIMMFAWVLLSFIESDPSNSGMEQLTRWYFIYHWEFQFVLLPVTILAFITLKQFGKRLSLV